MPTLEVIKSDRRLDKEGQEAFVIRTQDRIAQFKVMLAKGFDDPTKENPQKISAKEERDLVESEIVRLEGEVTQMLHQGEPVTPQPFQETTNALVSMVARLSEELAGLKAKLKGTNGPLSEPQAPAHT